MATLRYTIDIDAPKQKVWDMMLADQTYREWTSAFHEGSYFEGSWDKGSHIKFLAMDDGKLSGMSSKVIENIPYQFISLEMLGEVIDGAEDTTSERAKQWIGAHENYTLSEEGGTTTVDIELDGENVSPEMNQMFDNMWPQGLAKLKEIVERG